MTGKKATTKNNQPIGVFDSGVGGLSILIELKKLLPNENFVFFADQQHAPYGEKTKKELVKRCTKISNYFIEHHNIKMMVIACNTATANTVEALRKKYLFPIVGTIPAVKIASENTESGVITVISTPATSKSSALKKLIDKYCQTIKVFNIGTKDLAGLVEKGKFNSPAVNNILLKYLKEVKDSDADHLVLGCTHYPFLKAQISKILGSRVRLVDSGEAIAKHTKTLLISNKMKNFQKKKSKSIYFTTGNPVKFTKVASTLLKTRVKAGRVAI